MEIKESREETHKHKLKQYQKMAIGFFALFVLFGFFFVYSFSVKNNIQTEERVQNKQNMHKKSHKSGLYINGVFQNPTSNYAVVDNIPLYNYSVVNIQPGDVVEYYFGNDSFETFSYPGFVTQSIKKHDAVGNTFPFNSRQQSDYYGKVHFTTSKKTKFGIGTKK